MTATLGGLVLAGGRSRRMGADKAAIELAGMAMLERAVELLRHFLSDVRVAVRDEQRADALRTRFPLVVDVLRDAGPAAGMLAAHAAEPGYAWLVLACDMPGVDRVTLQRLIDARAPERAATAWSQAGGESAEPLCTIYEPATLARFRDHIAAGGDRSPSRWLAGQHVKLLRPGPDDDLRGINTPAELQAFRAGSQQRKQDQR